MLTMFGGEYIVEHSQEDADKIRTTIMEESCSMLGDFVIEDMVADFLQEGMRIALYKLSLTLNEVRVEPSTKPEWMSKEDE